MKKIVFYSWQSDLPNGTNRMFIENALKVVAKEIEKDTSTGIEPVIDRDTKGLAGAPNIAIAILQKIEKADIFVADVSIIGNVKKRAIPNPNVLIELGYALKALGHERIILVFNTAFGKVEKLPFDLRMHRILTYECAKSITDRSKIKKDLANDLKSALVTGFSNITSEKVTTTTIIDIIEKNTPSKKIEIRKYLTTVLKDLANLQPLMKGDGGTIEQLLSAVSSTKNISLEFSKLAETIVLMDDLDSSKEIFQWFGKILTKYDPILSGGIRGWNSDGDFYKIIGHELFVNFINPFLREKKWDEMEELLRGDLRVGPTRYCQNEINESWTELSEHSPWLLDEGKAKGRISLHGDLLKERHEEGGLASIVPFNEFAETDLFLHLYGKGKTQDKYRGVWSSMSGTWLENTPRFILEASDYSMATSICQVLQIDDIEEFRKRLTSLQIRGKWRRSPIAKADILNIGTKGAGEVLL